MKAAEPQKEKLWSAKALIPTDDKELEKAGNREEILRTKMGGYGSLRFELGTNPGDTVSFCGPEKCARVYKSGRGTCVLETRCPGKDLTKENFGLTCVHPDGASARHLFGENSFLAEEVFDSGIECALCMGLDVSMVLEEEKQSAKAKAKRAALKSTLEESVQRIEARLDGLEERIGKIEQTEKSLLESKREKRSSAPETPAAAVGGKPLVEKRASLLKLKDEPSLQQLVAEESGDYDQLSDDTDFLAQTQVPQERLSEQEQRGLTLLQKSSGETDY